MKTLTVLRILLYFFSTLAGISGLWIGGVPVAEHLVDRIDGSYALQPEILFRQGVILLVSLILLLCVHIGSKLAGGFSMENASEPKEKEALNNLSGTPWDTNKAKSRPSQTLD